MRRLAVMMALCLLLVLPTWAASHAEHSRGSAFELGMGVGYGSFGFGAQGSETFSSKTSGDVSCTAHFAYSCFFIEYMGISLGVDATRYAERTSLSGMQRWENVSDTEGERYEHRLMLDGWRETVSDWYLEIPLSLKFSIPMQDKAYFLIEAGGKWGMPLSDARYAAGGTITHHGYYDTRDALLFDLPQHGFYTESAFAPRGRVGGLRSKWSVFAKLGVAVPLVTHLDLTIQAYGQYSFTSVAKVGSPLPAGFRDDRAGMETVHYFMTDYRSLTTSPHVSGAAKPYAVGLELGLRYTIPHYRRDCYPCKVLRW